MKASTLNSQSILENITHTLLYEGYALYPYHRSAIKNQKPVPFGVVFPRDYNAYNVHSHANMQTQCIVTGSEDLQINISVRFLHLKKIELLKQNHQKTAKDDFIPVSSLNINDTCYQSGWQTIERTISTGNVTLSQLKKNCKEISIEFDKADDSKFIYDESDEVIAKQINSLSQIRGKISVRGASVANIKNAFQITISIENTTPIEKAESMTRDEVLSQSFLSTHIIAQTENGKFVSHQNPDEQWTNTMSECENLNTWPILIDEDHTTLLSSPIILYDYPEINPLSSGDLFDSTEIEEALLLHVSVLSEEEKKRISESDEKLQAMLSKMSQIAPEQLISFHAGLKENMHNQIHQQQKSGE